MQLNKKVLIVFIILILLLGMFVGYILSGAGSKNQLDINQMIEGMFPNKKIENLDLGRFKVYEDESHFTEYEIEKLLYGKFVDSNQEVLVILKVPEEKTGHQGGFYNRIMAVFNLKTYERTSPVYEFSSDVGEMGLFEGKNKTYLMIVGSTTFQGYTEYKGNLFDINRDEWINVFPKEKNFWENRKAVISPDGLILFKRVFERKGNELIPPSKFVFDKELLWDKQKETFLEE